LALGANPAFTPTQTRSFLEGRAIDLGSAGKDTRFGYGRLHLGTAPPSAPTLLTANPISTTQISLTWSNVVEETGYKVERNGVNGWNEVAAVGTNVISFTNTGLTCQTTYQYRIRAHNASGLSKPSNTLNATTQVCVPAAPTNLTATAVSTSQIKLTWVDQSTQESGFKIERSQEDGSSWSQISTVATNTTIYTDTGLTCDLTYHYRVRAYNISGVSNPSNTTNAIPGCGSSNNVFVPVIIKE
jgi:predicted phage tail protein